MTRRPPQPAPRCTVCNQITVAKCGLCRDCRAGVDPLPLPEGRCVPNGRGVVVYRVGATGLGVGAA